MFGVGVACLPPLLPLGDMHSLPVSLPVGLQWLLRPTTHFCLWWFRLLIFLLVVLSALSVRDVRAPGKVSSLCVIIGLGFFFLEFIEVSVLSLVVHCWGGEFSYGLHVCGGFLVRCIQASTLF